MRQSREHGLTRARLRRIWRTMAIYKIFRGPEWDAFALIDNGIFPQPLTSRKFAQICTN